MPWTPEQRSHYAPAISKTVRANATVRLAKHHRRDRPAGEDRPAAAVVDPDHARGAVVAVPGRRGLGAAHGRLSAAADDRRPSAGILDTQSVRTGPQAGPRGYDAHKKIPTGPPALPSMAASACS